MSAPSVGRSTLNEELRASKAIAGQLKASNLATGTKPLRTRSMHRKLAVGFILIFAIATCCLYFYMSHALERQTLKTIEEDMRKLQMFAYEQIMQYQLFHETTEQQLARHVGEMMNGLSRSSGHQTAYYDKGGLFQTEVSFARNSSVILQRKEPAYLKQHMEITRAGGSIVTIERTNSKRLAVFSFPLYINDRYEGMFLMTIDYTARFMQNAAILRSVALFGLLLFLVVTLFSFYMTRRMIRPLAALSQAMRRFGEGKPLAASLPLQTNDEVGALARSFEQMKQQLAEQIEHLDEERNRVIELEQSRRRFYEHVTHELKTPLTTISGYAQIIGEADFDDPLFLSKAAGAIKTESERLHGMVVQVIELARKEEQRMESEQEQVELAVELAGCCDDMALKAARYHMILNSHLEPVTIKGWKDELRQVWINLLDNAIKYGAAGTSIEIQLTKHNNLVLICFSNEPELHESEKLAAAASRLDEELVFEPFYRIAGVRKQEAGSVGLGLTISRSIVERHNGTILFERQEQRVTVSVTLPLSL